MNAAATIKAKPWIGFLLLALVMQQANMLTYKFGGQIAVPQVFLAYSFMFQALLNFALIFFFKSRGFPVTLQGKMKAWVVFVSALYLANELLFVIVYRLGAPYSLMMVVFSCVSLVLLTLFAVISLKEKMHMRQITGLALALVSIYLIRMG